MKRRIYGVRNTREREEYKESGMSGKRYESEGGGTTYYIADESYIGCLAILLSMLLPDFIIKR